MKINSGMLIEISLGEGVFSYCQAVGKAQYAFFDYFGEALTNEQLKKLDYHNVIFVIAVMDSAVKKGRWKIVGTSQLRPELKSPKKYFIQDVITNEFSIYNGDTGVIQPASLSEISGLERAAVWEAEQVESRLGDFFNKKSNDFVKDLSPKIQVNYKKSD